MDHPLTEEGETIESILQLYWVVQRYCLYLIRYDRRPGPGDKVRTPSNDDCMRATKWQLTDSS